MRTWTIHFPATRICAELRQSTAPTGGSAGRSGTRPAPGPARMPHRPTVPARNRSAPAARPGRPAASAPPNRTTCAPHCAASPNSTPAARRTCAPSGPDLPPFPGAADPRSDTAPSSERPLRHRLGHGLIPVAEAFPDPERRPWLTRTTIVATFDLSDVASGGSSWKWVSAPCETG